MNNAGLMLTRPMTAQDEYGNPRQVGVTLLSRAKGRHLLVYNGFENIELDEQLPAKATVHPAEHLRMTPDVNLALFPPEQ